MGRFIYFARPKITYSMTEHWKYYALGLIALVIFLIPNLFWGNLYIMGGDDARLYYLFPVEYLKNFSFNVMSGNTLGGNLGYMPVSYSAPIIALLAILKYVLPFVNTQLLAYGMICSLGFIFFFLFLQEWVTRKTPYYFWISVAASLFYILSTYISRTYFQSQFISIYIIMVLPGCLWLFLAGVKHKRAPLVVASSLLYSMFSATVFSFPWFLAAVITLAPLVLYLAVRYGWYFCEMACVFLGVVILCNFYWIIHYIVPVLGNTKEANFTASLVTNSFIQQNNDIIAALSHLNSPVHQMINYLRVSWQDRSGVTVVESIGIVYLGLIVSAGVVLGRVKKNLRILYVVAGFGLLMAMLLVTPNFGLWNLQLFQFLNAHVPFFVIFRSMYDKFALAMAFHYAFALWISLVVLGEAKIKRTYVYAAVVVVLLVTIWRAVPYMVPDYKGTGHSTHISGLNEDYMDLTRYIAALHTTSRFLWYPLTFGDYVYLSDDNNPGHYYVGISPLQIFARASDLAGFYGLQTPGDPELNWTVLDLFKNKNFKKAGQIFRQLNVGYVIVNHEKMPPNGPFILEQFDFVKHQEDEEYKKTILGEKIRDFGDRYSLYAINPSLAAPTVFLADDIKDGESYEEIPFYKTADGAYEIGPFTISGPTHLVLMEPYSRLWNIRRLDGNKHATVREESMLAYGYGNAWALDSSHMDGSASIRVRAEFGPNSLILPSLVISIVSGIMAAAYCAVSFLRKRKKV